jgi:hypothetical protein
MTRIGGQPTNPIRRRPCQQRGLVPVEVPVKVHASTATRTTRDQCPEICADATSERAVRSLRQYGAAASSNSRFAVLSVVLSDACTQEAGSRRTVHQCERDDVRWGRIGCLVSGWFARSRSHRSRHEPQIARRRSDGVDAAGQQRFGIDHLLAAVDRHAHRILVEQLCSATRFGCPVHGRHAAVRQPVRQRRLELGRRLFGSRRECLDR